MRNKSNLFADFKINEEVIIFDKKGNIVDEGILTRIEKNEKSSFFKNTINVQVGANSYRLYATSWSLEYIFINKKRYQLALDQELVDEMADVASRYIKYGRRDMSAAQCAAIMQKVEELMSLVQPIAEAQSEKNCTPQSFLKMWGLSSFTPEDITSDFNKELVFLPHSYGDHMTEIIARHQPLNVVSILDGSFIESPQLSIKKGSA